MNTKTFNHFRNTFAFIGFFIIACSVGTVEDETPEVEPPVVQNNIGKYQVAGMSDDNYIVILNTENGKLKSYYRQNNQWNEFNAGDLTVSH